MPENWTEIEIAGKRCDVWEPAQRAVEPAAILYLHGVQMSRLQDNPAFAAPFAALGHPIIAPFGARSWWTNRVCEEFDRTLTAERHILDNVLPYIASRWNISPPLVALLGTSMGGQGALRLAFRHPDKFPIAAAIAPAIDFQIRYDNDPVLQQMYDDAEAARQDTATLHVHPLNWPRNLWFCCDPDDRWHEGADRLQMKLGALGIPHDYDLTTRAGGHGFEYYTKMAPTAAAFIAERLGRERRRV